MINRDTRISLILNECRELMTIRLSQLLTSVMNSTDDALFDLSRQEGPSRHAFYFNAMREIRLKRKHIETVFNERISRSFKDILHEARSVTDAESNKKADLCDDTTEELIATENTALRIRNDCHHALLSLDQHMGTLLEGVDTKTNHNPVCPERVCRSFQEACSNVESGIEIKLILFKIFEKYAVTDLQEIYSDIDSILTDNEIPVTSVSASEFKENKQDLSQNKDLDIKSPARGRNYYLATNTIIQHQIREHLGKDGIPDFVRDFFLTYWSKLLLKIHIRDGTEKSAWKNAIDVIDDLVKCLNHKSATEEMPDSADYIQNLIQRLKYGMNVIPVPGEYGKKFISELLQYYKDLQISVSDKAIPERCDTTDEKFTPVSAGKKQTVPFMHELLVDNKK